MVRVLLVIDKMDVVQQFGLLQSIDRVMNEDFSSLDLLDSLSNEIFVLELELMSSSSMIMMLTTLIFSTLVRKLE